MLTKKNRLTTKDFLANKSRNDGFWRKMSYLGVKSIKNSQKQSRFGFVVGTNVSKNAAKRNLIKRRLRYIIRENIDSIKIGYDVVIVVYPPVKDAGYKDIEWTLLSILRQIRLLEDVRQ